MAHSLAYKLFALFFIHWSLHNLETNDELAKECNCEQNKKNPVSYTAGTQDLGLSFIHSLWLIFIDTCQ